MKLSQVYKSNYMRCEDLEGKPKTLTIKDVEMGSLPDGKEQLLVSFKNHDQQLGLNKTNANMIAELYGDETDNWVGKRITLYPTRVDFQGKRVDAIRIKESVPNGTADAANDEQDNIPF